jgi:hypothetical protein
MNAKTKIVPRWLSGGVLSGLLIAGTALYADNESTTTKTRTKVKSSKRSPDFDENRAVEGPPRGDNTGKNAGDAPTADAQKNDKSDLEITAKIRRSVVSDKQLSVAAQNVKIITQSGVVTLKGPVKSTNERSIVAKKASEVAGPENVRNELDVAP